MRVEWRRMGVGKEGWRCIAGRGQGKWESRDFKGSQAVASLVPQVLLAPVHLEDG